MMNDEQPRLAILGAGPIGLEVALYARYLGYPSEILERAAEPAPNVSIESENSVGAFKRLASTLGIAALRAQNPAWQAPRISQQLTGNEWRQRYLMPLAESDLISDVLHLATEVIHISRRDEPEDVSFHIRCRRGDGDEVTHTADIIMDATGAPANRDWFPDEPADPEISFLNPAADYYVLGAKSRPEKPFTFAEGLTQIRELFAILGERNDLDVYATLPGLE